MSTRPYFIIYEGKPRMVEANSPAVAVHHVVGAAITEIRPARGAEVSAWLRGGKEIEIAGQKPADNSQGTLVVEDGGFNANDARAWLVEQFADMRQAETTLPAFDRMAEQGHMTLEDFEEMRTLSGEFIAAVAEQDPTEVDGERFVDIAEISNALKDAPMPFDQVVRLIGEAKRRELFEDVVEATVEHGTNGTKVAK
jgi:hypothetical protein